MYQKFYIMTTSGIIFICLFVAFISSFIFYLIGRDNSNGKIIRMIKDSKISSRFNYKVIDPHRKKGFVVIEEISPRETIFMISSDLVKDSVRSGSVVRLGVTVKEIKEEGLYNNVARGVMVMIK